MKAVVLTEDAEIQLAERDAPVIGKREVLVRVQLAGICGTDLHAPQMPGMFADGVVLGHEFAGLVADLGVDCNGLRIGQKVVVNPIAMACAACEACRRGLTNQCLGALSQVTGVAHHGGMAELVAVDRRAIHVVPDDVPLEEAAWTEPLAVALRAVEHGPVVAGTTVAILGAGAIGQLILQLALNAGAADVLVVEKAPLRRKVAETNGATQVVAPESVPDVERLFDVVFDCTGAPEAFPSSTALVGHKGRIVVLGTYTAPLSLRTVGREALIVFSSVYRNDREFAAALRLLARGAVDTSSLTTSVLPLGAWEEAFEAQRNPDLAVKIFLEPTR
jgi:2-desacetyl-2-hydroxyethyl bacteriochlorophyllide A dehydrogenase